MLSKPNNTRSFKKFSLKNQDKNSNYNSKTFIKMTSNKEKKNNNKNPKITSQKEKTKPKIKKTNNMNSNNINNNKNKYKLITSETQNIENKNNINKDKKNNVTNNICIIIKTSNNKEPEEDKNFRNFRYDDSLRNILNYPMTTGHIDAKNIGANDSFKRHRINNISKSRYNNSFTTKSSKSERDKKISFNTSIHAKINLLKHKKQLIMGNKKMNTERPKKLKDFKNEPIKNIFKSKNRLALSPSNEKIKNHKFTQFRSLLFSDIADNYIKTSRNNVSFISAQKSRKKNEYKQSIELKKELLGINLNNKEKKQVNRKLFEVFVDNEKQKEEIKKEILKNKVFIENEEKLKDNSSIKKNIHQRIFSDDMTNKSNKFDTTLNESNISKSDISNIQKEYNKYEINKCIKLIKTGKNNNITRNINNNIYTQTPKVKSNNNRKNTNYLNYKQSINTFNNKNDSNNKLSSNTSFITNKSYMDLFIPESKIKKNTNIIMNEIIKIMNTNKSKKKIVSPKKIREKLFSPSKNEVVLIQNNENGKTMRCIKKRCKDRSKNNTISIKENENDKNESDIIDKEKDKEENNNEEKINDKEDDNNKIIDNTREKDNNKEENKIMEIKIPEQQIEALRRIKLTIANYKKSKKKFIRNISNKTLKKSNSFGFLNNIRFIENNSEIRRLHSGTINCKRNKLYDFISN